ncbi:Sec-independent protein translocase subunit TatA [Lysobacter sp. GX 14042]|uniref:Sec-independent protein translocase subunit TatA n=1 Tax=Lysobacter sp. GX 14042 TaxID=2907155 RepID=UPI001F1CA462|nr:Sec-independent protein translocase subunit TatA [Lysobacter sp. GX 14042]MCE7032409.1 Sec-independent protein translocase subunit TatA [Lysobacter sp. GX 14042]
MGTFSIWHWVVVLVIVVLVFGTRRLKNVGRDVGEAVKGFKQGLSGEDEPPRRELSDERNERTDTASRSGGDDRERDTRTRR